MRSTKSKKSSRKSTTRIATRKSAHAVVKADPTNIEKERYRVLIEDVADGFYEVDLKGNFKFFNDALCRIFGYSRRKIRNSNFQEYMDAHNAAIAYEAFNKIFRTREGVVDINWKLNVKTVNGATWKFLPI